MSGDLSRRAAGALGWKVVHLAGGRAISLVRFLVLARLLAPDDFGLLAIGLVAIEILLTVTDTGMVPALVQRTELSRRDYDAAWTVEASRSIVVVAAVVAGAPLFADLFDEPAATAVIRGLAVATLISSLESIRLADLIRDLRFRPLAIRGIAVALTEAVVSIALASSLGVWALVVGLAAAALVGTVLSYVIAPYRPRPVFDPRASGRLFAFGRWVLLTSVAMLLGDAIVRVVLSRRLGAGELGLYYVAFRLAQLPARVVTEIVETVAFSLYARIQHDLDRVAATYRDLLVTAAALLVPAYAILFVLAPDLVAVLGERWDGATPVIRVLVGAGIASLVGASTAPLLQGVGRPDRVAAIYVVRAGVVALVVGWLTGWLGVVGAAAAWLAAEVAGQGLGMHHARRVVPGAFRGLGGSLASIALGSAAGAAVAVGVTLLLGGLAALLVGVPLAGAASVVAGTAIDRWWEGRIVERIVAVFPALGGVPLVRRLTDAGAPAPPGGSGRPSGGADPPGPP